MINEERIKNLLLELVQIDSVSREERDVAERIKQLCEEMGALLLAKKTGQPVLPFGVNAERFWRLPSWDGLQIPKPFTRVRVRFAPPIRVPVDADDAALEAKREELQRALESVSP